MALETLRGTDKIDGFAIDHTGTGKEFISINHDANTITFTIQNKPIKEAGVNGCQIDTLIAAAWIMLADLNKNFHSPHNDTAIQHLADAYAAMKMRKADREKRGVEGTMQK